MLNELLLLSGNDIPFSKARLTIHQPTMKEIAYIGEETFFVGCELLNFSKRILSEEDRNNLSDVDDFDILMSIITDRQTQAMQKSRACALLVLTIIFPDYHIRLAADQIMFMQKKEDGGEGEEELELAGSITKDVFKDFKDIIVQMLCLNQTQDAPTYDPSGAIANRIAAKLEAGRAQKAALSKGSSNKVAVFSRYISILAVGEQKTIPELLQYTVYQLFDEYKRFELKSEYDIYFQAKLAGAKDMKEPEHWMKDIHETT